MPPHPRLFFGMRPGINQQGETTVSINSLGWRGPEFDQKPRPDLYRVMFLGDSSVWGDGVSQEESFPYLFEKLLQQLDGRAVESLNAATPGYSSVQSRIVFEDHVDIFRPNAVVIASLWSDIIVRPWQDKDLLRKFSTEGGYRFDSPLRDALRLSALFSWLEARIEGFKGIPDNHQIVMSAMINPDVHPWSDGRPRVSIADHRENLRAIADAARDRGMDICLLILQCDPVRFPWPKERLAAYRQNFRDAAAAYGALLVDVPALYPKEPTALSAMFYDGIHPTAEGHRLIAEELARVFSAKQASAR
ncbi:MAG: SGNH/GDSL hydrolase family protein [Deltaproteobacteria bacterium]|nr:SGNH/GDSL hydrolase family protein [Deltaproteobacteria bacterium]